MVVQPTQIETFTLETSDFGHLEESADGWDQRYDQMSSGQFRGSLELSQVGGTQIFREKWSQSIHYQGTAPEGTFGMALPISQAGLSRWVGLPVDINTAVLQAPGQAADMMATEEWDTLAFALPEAQVSAALATMSGGKTIDFADHATIALSPGVAQRIRRMGLDHIAFAFSADAKDGEEVKRRSDQAVFLWLSELLRASDDSSVAHHDVKAMSIFRQAVDFIDANQDRAVGLVEICETLGIGLRSLNYAFNEVADISPSAWLRRHRLNRVHRALRAAEPGTLQVKKIAWEYGFDHLGHFSQQYRRLFGCTPSETLRVRK